MPGCLVEDMPCPADQRTIHPLFFQKSIQQVGIDIAIAIADAVDPVAQIVVAQRVAKQLDDALLGLFLDFTPFTRSELTESLRHYFNQWLIEPIATRGRFNARKKTAGNAPPEAIIGQILVQAKAAWVVLFLTFTALWLLPYLGRIKHLALNPAAKITVLGFGAFLLFCLADDIYSGLMGADDPFHIRRLWRKRPRGKRSEAARKTIEDFQDRTSFSGTPAFTPA